MTIEQVAEIAGQQILSTGSMILQDGEPARFTFREGNDAIILEIIFEAQPKSEAKTESNISGNDTLRITLINWQHHGVRSIQVGTLNGRPVYLKLASQPLPPTHILNYTFTMDADR